MTAVLQSVLAGSTTPGLFAWRGAADQDLLADARDAGWSAMRLDTTGARTAADFYNVVVEDWSLPDWFGRNLDALWDVLGDRLTTPTVLVWDGAESFATHDPDLAVVVLGLLRDASVQSERLVVIVRPESEPILPGTLLSELDGLL